MGQVASSLWTQSVFLPKPVLTEKNLEDQTGKVHIVTGGYGGVGLELCKILYGKNATVYVAGRSQEKGDKALKTLKQLHPNSNGKVEFLSVDLSDLSTVKPAAEKFLAKEKRLDVLTNNAGVMFPPAGSKDSHGHELQIGTNCLGPYLLAKLLTPLMDETASKSPEGTVRVTWAGSLAVDIMSPKGGQTLDKDGKPSVLGPKTDYGQSKTGNLFLASESARRFGKSGVVHVCFNPGNLATDLSRHSSWLEQQLLPYITYPAIFGAYTELYCACSKEIGPSQNGAFVMPWGRVGGYRDDITKGLTTKEQGGLGNAQLFWDWCESQTKSYA